MIGRTFGHYRVDSKLGEGGMGVVYRANDTVLGRDVAIKMLPSAFSENREWLARFHREARVLAALNHPSIAAIYGLEQSDAGNYLVMELVEGETLDERMQAGAAGTTRGRPSPILVEEALDICRHVAEALETAHGRGIVHRDLKPANVKITPEGRVKVLDFGLAKPIAEPEGQDLSEMPTVTAPPTILGQIVGTPAYMSPEQARGKAVDGRADIWAFGCLLYELLAGRRPFRGDTTLDTLAAVMEREPDWNALPAATPARIRELLRRCLQKDPARRLQDIGDARIAIEEAEEESEPAKLVSERRRPHWSRWAIVLGVAVAIVILVFWPMPAPQTGELIPFATESEVQTMPRWSPKGDRIAYVAAVDSVLQVFAKSPGSSAPTQITHEKRGCLNPMWSPDGTRIYFLTGNRPNRSVRSIAVAGGSSEMVLDRVFEADLSPDGKTIAAMWFDSAGHYQLAFSSPPGAAPRPYSRPPLPAFPDASNPAYPRFDPSGKFLGLFGQGFWKIPMDDQPPEEMLHGSAGGIIGHYDWLPNGAGIVTDVNGAVQDNFHLWLLDWSSKTKRSITAGASRDNYPSLSPDGSTVAFASGELGFDIVELPLDGSPARDVLATSRQEIAPAWAPDGIHFAYVTDRNGGTPEIWLRNRTDHSERRIVGSKELPSAEYFQDCAISPDGTRIAYRVHGRGGGPSIWISPLTGDVPVKLWDDPAQSAQRGPAWSPDGDWIAYAGLRNGKAAVMKVRVGANTPSGVLAEMTAPLPMVRWSPRGDWIAFRDGDALKVVSPDGIKNRVVSQRSWQTYGWSKDGSALYGIAYGEDHRLILGKIDVATAKESRIADLGPIPPAFDLSEDFNELSYRGFSMHPDGKSFLISMLRAKMQIYLMKESDHGVRLIDRWLGSR